jgi:glycosyltransferase involved in cell wall biosynthesis
MQAGLPVITVDYGGPAFITDDACAIRLQLGTPEALARDLAAAIRTLYHDPERRAAMGQAARTRVAAEGLWPRKIDRLLGLYETVSTAPEMRP